MTSIIRKKAITVGLFTIAVLALALVVFFLQKNQGPNPLPKFLAYFDKPGIVHVTYKAPKGNKYEEWFSYRSERIKELMKYSDGETSLTVVDGKIVKEYKEEGHYIDAERLSKDNMPGLTLITQAAKDGKLKLTKRKDGLAYYKIEEKREDGTLIAPHSNVVISEKTGRFKGTIASGEMTSVFKVERIERIPESESSSIFNFKELTKKQLRGPGRDLGFTASSLRKFKDFPVYWLGPSFKGTKVSSMDSYKMHGETTVSINYGLGYETDIEIVEESIDSSDAKDAWKYIRPVKRIIVQGKPAKLQQNLSGNAPGELIVQYDNTQVSIINGYFKNQSEFIEYVEKNLRRP